MQKADFYRLLLERLIENVQTMFELLLFALPLGIIVGAITFLLMRRKEKKAGKQYCRGEKTVTVLFVTYIFILAQLTIFFRPFGKIAEIEIIPFRRLGGLRYIVLYSLSNIIAFVPMGIFLPQIGWKKKTLLDVLVMGFFCSVLIEAFQLILQCGVCQTEDLIMNTLGAGIGYWIYKKRKGKDN